jgi:hypothetical protein
MELIGRPAHCGEAFAARLAGEGFRSTLVWVLGDNPFRAFYVSLGGVEVKRKKIRIGGATLGEVSYGWRLISPAP